MLSTFVSSHIFPRTSLINGTGDFCGLLFHLHNQSTLPEKGIKKKIKMFKIKEGNLKMFLCARTCELLNNFPVGAVLTEDGSTIR